MAARRSKQPENRSDKDAKGRFLPGNKAAVGRGRPRNKARESIQKALGGESGLADLVDKLKESALDGDVQAARTLIEMGWGKPREQERMVELPTTAVDSASDVEQIIREIVAGMAAGTIDPTVAVEMLRAATMARTEQASDGDDDTPDEAYL